MTEYPSTEGRGVTADKVVDFVTPMSPYSLLSAATAPGGRWLSTPLRGFGRQLVEGVGLGLAGGLGAAAIDPEYAPLGLALGAGAGVIHGGYASRRNIREETGDYNPLGWGADKEAHVFADTIKLATERVKVALRDELMRGILAPLDELAIKNPAEHAKAADRIAQKLFTTPEAYAAYKAESAGLAGKALTAKLYEHGRAVRGFAPRNTTPLQGPLAEAYGTGSTRSTLHARINRHQKARKVDGIRQIYGGKGQYMPYDLSTYGKGGMKPEAARALYNERQKAFRERRQELGWSKRIPDESHVKKELAEQLKHDGELSDTAKQVKKQLSGKAVKGPDGKTLRPDQLPLVERKYTRPPNAPGRGMGWGRAALIGAGALGLGYGAYKMLSGNKKKEEQQPQPPYGY